MSDKTDKDYMDNFQDTVFVDVVNSKRRKLLALAIVSKSTT